MESLLLSFQCKTTTYTLTDNTVGEKYDKV